jgi:hypothetical protein
MSSNWLVAATFAMSCACLADGGFTVKDTNDPDVPDTAQCRPSDIQTIYLDADGDGYGDPAQSAEDCIIPDGWVDNNLDCNDAEPLAYTGATELCGDRIDNDCSGSDACEGSLVAHWGFTESTGLIAADDSGNLLEGTLQGGLIHSSDPTLTFDGQDDYVEVLDTQLFQLSASTLSFWFMPTTLGIEQGLVSKDAGGNGAGGHLSIYYDLDGTVRARLQSSNQTYEISSLPVAVNQWHHVNFTFGGNEGMTLYVDDIEAGKDPYTGGLINNLEPLVIGASTDNSQPGSALPINKAFAGQITKAQFYDRQLLRGELTSLMLVTDPRL